MWACNPNNVNQQWVYNPATMQMKSFSVEICLSADGKSSVGKMSTCADVDSQKWEILPA